MPKPTAQKHARTFPPVEDISGRRFAFFGVNGEFSNWGDTIKHAAKLHGALIQSKVTRDLDYLVIGPVREKGRADAIRKGEKFSAEGSVQVLDPHGFNHLLRPNLSGATFFFTGGFDPMSQRLIEEAPEILGAAGASVAAAFDESVNVLVIGAKRGKGKTSTLRMFDERKATGEFIIGIDEASFARMVSSLRPPDDTDSLTLGRMITELRAMVKAPTERKIGRSMAMLKKSSFQLYSEANSQLVTGVVRSQTSNSVYSVWLDREGKFLCTDTELDHCMGQQGGICKHLLVLVFGLCGNGDLEPADVWPWLLAASRKRPVMDNGTNTATLLRYKGAEAGEVDWRPTETVPEDYYVF